MQIPGPSLWTIFHSPCRLSTDAGEIEVTVLPIDPIAVPSGRMVLGDPLVDIYYTEPLTHELPPGRYSVRLATATGVDGVFACLVRFLPVTAVRWEPTEPDRHGVDSGSSGLIDYKLARTIQRKSEEWFERHLNRCSDALESAEPWGNRRLNRETGANLLLFRTATGDGHYPSFFGYSATGDLVCLVTDFFLEAAVRDVVVGGTPT
jgi:Protein of unknown function (DUF4241)